MADRCLGSIPGRPLTGLTTGYSHWARREVQLAEAVAVRVELRGRRLGFGRIVASAAAIPNLLADLV